MEKPCISSVLMAALTVGFIIADYFFNYGNYVLRYIFLGSVTTILFYVMCLNKFETINWVFVGIMALYILFTLLYKQFRQVEISDTSDMCDSCEMEQNECKYNIPKPKSCIPKSCIPKKPKC